MIIDPTTTVIGNEDVYLQDVTNYGSNASLIIGKSSGTNKKRTIMKFDVSSVPGSATVINAQMKLRYYGTSGTPWIDRSVQAHQLLVNWNETQATCDVRLTGTSWASQYGAINGTDAKAAMESATLFKVNEFPVWKNWDLTTLTQNWVNGTITNYGVILWATNEDTDGMNLWFRSSEYSDSNFHPRLEVTWLQTLQAVYFLKDHLGSIRATVLDSTGAPILGYDDYDPWGYPLAQRAKPIPSAYLQGGSKIKFTGNEFDDDFGLNFGYHIDRYYDHQIGRWWVVDPLNEYASPYIYAGNSPTNLIDPTGMYSEWGPSYIATKYFVDKKLVYDDGVDNGLEVYTTNEIIKKYTDKNGNVNWDAVRNDKDSSTLIADQGKYEAWKNEVRQLVDATLGLDNVDLSIDNKGNVTLLTSADMPGIGSYLSLLLGPIAITKSLSFLKDFIRFRVKPGGFTKEELEELRWIEQNLAGFDRARQRLGVLSEASLRKGYTSEQTAKMMKGLFGGQRMPK